MALPGPARPIGRVLPPVAGPGATETRRGGQPHSRQPDPGASLHIGDDMPTHPWRRRSGHRPRGDRPPADGDVTPATHRRMSTSAGQRTPPAMRLPGQRPPRRPRPHAGAGTHPPARTRPPVSTGGRLPACWGRACRRTCDAWAMRRVVEGRRIWSAFSPGHTRQQRCAQQPNATLQALPEAGARHERRL